MDFFECPVVDGSVTTGALSTDAAVEAGEAATLGIRRENVSRGRDGEGPR
ncbi:MAG: hypothetical protein V5A28_05670 [Haloarculaceae archaeon]